jgi:hypothetical protein
MAARDAGRRRTKEEDASKNNSNRANQSAKQKGWIEYGSGDARRSPELREAQAHNVAELRVLT